MKKLLLTLGTAGSVMAPLATVVACGATSTTSSAFAPKYTINSKNTGGYGQSFTDLAAGDVDLVGAWGDSRFYAGDSADTIEAIGVETTRIANDGIQARSDMNVNDIAIIQALFVELHALAETEAGLQVPDEDGEDENLFDVYSHAGYQSTSSKTEEVAFLDRGHTTSKAKMTVDPGTAASAGTIFEAVSDISDINNFKTNSGQTLRIEFIPSNDPARVTLATQALSKYLTDKGIDNQISVAADYNTAASKLENKTIDLSFLPVNTWATLAPSSQFILQAARPTQVNSLLFSARNEEIAFPGTHMGDQYYHVNAMNLFGQLYVSELEGYTSGDWSGETGNKLAFEEIYTSTEEADAPMKEFAIAAVELATDNAGDARMMAGSYESWLYTKEGSDIHKAAMAEFDKPEWSGEYTLEFDGLEEITYGYTSNTSSASYVFPEMWIYNHLNASIKL